MVLFSTVVAVGIFSLSLIVVIAFLLCKRIKLYGGLYIFSYPPMPDYIEKLDYSKDIREQVQKLPYVQEWEFPRDKISLRMYIIQQCTLLFANFRIIYIILSHCYIRL